MNNTPLNMSSDDDVVYEDDDDWDDEDDDDQEDDDDDYDNNESDDDGDGDGEFEDEEDEDEDDDYKEQSSDDDDDDDEEDDNERKYSLFCVIIMCLCCCIILGLAGALVGVYVFDDFDNSNNNNNNNNNKENEKDKTSPNNKPTTEKPSISFLPTNLPSNQPSISTKPSSSQLPSISPSSQPTISFAPSDFVPEYFEFLAYQDTTITNSEPWQTDVSYGSNEVLIVFKGPIDSRRSDGNSGLETTTTTIESFSLIAFNITELPSLDNPIYTNRQTSALLKLQHIPRPGSGPINMTISRLDNVEATNIEDMTYDTWVWESIDDDVVLSQTYFEVLPDQIYVDIDVTDLLFYNTMRRRGLRKLEPTIEEEEEEDNDDDDDSSFLVFQITRTTASSTDDDVVDNDVDLATTTELPNRFHSRESTSTSPPPILEIQLTIPSDNPTISIQPSTATTIEPSTTTNAENAPTTSPTIIPTSNTTNNNNNTSS